MADLDCTEIVERDQNGDIVKIGASWRENSGEYSIFHVVGKVVLFLGCALLAGLGIVGFYMARQPGNPVPFLSYVLALITFAPGLGGMILVARRQPRRSLLFHRDGAVETPQGLPANRSARIWGKQWSQSGLKQIEACGHPGMEYETNNWRVDLIGAKGDTVTVSTRLYRDEARKIAIVLKQAWDTLHPTPSFGD